MGDRSKSSPGAWSRNEAKGTPLRLCANLDTGAKQKVQAILCWCGRDPDTKLALLSDGEDGLRGVIGWFGTHQFYAKH
jgi:hypothetical protein